MDPDQTGRLFWFMTLLTVTGTLKTEELRVWRSRLSFSGAWRSHGVLQDAAAHVPADRVSISSASR